MPYVIGFAPAVLSGILWSFCMRLWLNQTYTGDDASRRLRVASEINHYVALCGLSSFINSLVMVSLAPTVVHDFLSTTGPGVVQATAQFGVFLPASVLSLIATVLTVLVANHVLGGLVDKFAAALRLPKATHAS